MKQMIELGDTIIFFFVINDEKDFDSINGYWMRMCI